MTVVKRIVVTAFFLQAVFCFAQKDTTVPFFKGALKENRIKLYNSLVKNLIIKNIILPLADSTEENWMLAFDALQITQYNDSLMPGRISHAFDSAKNRSVEFQRSLVELMHSNFPGRYVNQVKQIIETDDIKLFGLCAAYLLKYDSSANIKNDLLQRINTKFATIIDTPLLKCLCREIEQKNIYPSTDSLASLFRKDFLSGNIIMYSIQRKNRNYPGMVIIRNSDGNFVYDSTGQIFYTQQLARSITNLPYYLSRGNTPQGIYNMNGFAVSKSYNIGRTPNIQLAMPFEISLQKYFSNPAITDTIWTEEWYKKLLPEKLKNYFPLYESFYAGKAGRTEIIAHGTTVNPDYYKGLSFYPHTPSEGCLSTIEFWSEETGRRKESNQQKLVDAFNTIGSAHGYCVVLEINDEERPVTIQDILPFLKAANEK